MSKKVDQMLAEQRKKAAEGTTKPLPTQTAPKNEAEAKEQKELEEKTVKAARMQNKEIEEARKKLEALKKQLADAKAAEKAERDKLGNAKKAEQEVAKKELETKKKLLEAADAKVKAADEARQATKEWAAWDKAAKEREAIGPLPKVRKTGSTRKSSNGLNGSEIRVMQAIMDAGHALSRKDLSAATGQEKGWSKLLGTKDGGNGGLCDRGLLALVQHEDEPMRYNVTAAGKEALKEASK